MSIKEVLMERDNMTKTEAKELIEDARNALNERLQAGNISGAEYVCEEFFGLEPDYLEELL